MVGLGVGVMMMVMKILLNLGKNLILSLEDLEAYALELKPVLQR